MPDEWWSRVSESLEHALAVPTGERARWMGALALRDQALHDEVSSLLAAHEREAGRFEEPAVARFGAIAATPGLEAGQVIGPYRVIREVGRGGMGSVFEAVRVDGDFQKRVAIKIIAGGRWHAALLKRFRQERRILARLEHRNIAALLDGGGLPDGAPYFAMEFVEGEPIDEYSASRALPVRERLQLMRQVCGAVHFAHQNLVVHRDLKPGNILVTADGTVKLLDFGIAKLLAGGDDSSDPEQDLTGLGAGPFTLAYASPEQVLGDPVTTASDVHALGAVLYRVLTGRHPFRDRDTAPSEMRRRILEATPAPSGLGPDLDAILGTAMHKEPGRRYESALAFAEDLRRYLEGQPVRARPDSTGYRLRKFARRNRVPVGASVLALAALLAAVVVSTRQARIAAEERDRARVEAAKANRVTAFVQEMLRAADPREARPDLTVSEALAAAALRADSTLADEPEVLSAVQTAIGLSYLGLGRYDAAEPMLRRALALRQALGGANAGLAASLRNLAVLHNDRGELAPAEWLFTQSLAAYRRASPPDSAGLALALNDQADLLQYTGDLPGAEAAHREALAIRERLDGPRSESVAASLNNLAVVLGQLGQWTVAESLHMASAGIVLERRGPDHPDVASALTSAAFAVQAQGRFAEAESLYRAALRIRVKVLGPGHPETARTHMNLGWMLHDSKRYPEALEEATLVLSNRTAFGDDHPAIGSTLTMQGQSLLALGRIGEGEASLRDALRIRERALPPGHWLIAASRSAVGEALLLRGRYAEAERLLLDALVVLRKERGEDQELTALAKARLVRLYERWGKPGEAAKYR